jgi:hypothetical protein
MFWTFLIAVATAFVLIQLGALSVWVSVLSLSLKAMLGTILVVALFAGLLFVWRRYRGDR